MSKHGVLLLAASVFLVGCDRSADLYVRVVNETPEGERGLANLPVRLLPYNRDSIFDLLEQRSDEPEPPIPEDLLALRDSVSEAQETWRAAEAEWNETRSELQELAEQLQGLDRSSDEYFQGFQRFEQLEAQEQRLNREKDSLFESFTQLQNRYNTRADSMEAVRDTWANIAFEDYNDIVDSLLEASGRAELWDTTDAGGWALFRAPKGEWWAHTRYALPYEELYWNVHVGLTASDTLVLDPQNAELRPLF